MAVATRGGRGGEGEEEGGEQGRGEGENERKEGREGSGPGRGYLAGPLLTVMGASYLPRCSLLPDKDAVISSKVFRLVI